MAAILGLMAALPAAPAKTPGTTYCYKDVCHRVRTLAETRSGMLERITLVASYYDHCTLDPLNPCGLTSSGEAFRPDDDDTAASPIFPDGTRLLVWSPANGLAAVIRINNAGPYFSTRLLDASRGLAERLGFASRGIARLEAMVVAVPSRAESRYAAGRRYDPVPGVIGAFPTIEAAWIAWRALPEAAGPMSGSGLTVALEPPPLEAWRAGRARFAEEPPDPPAEVAAAAVEPDPTVPRIVRIMPGAGPAVSGRRSAGRAAVVPTSVVLKPVHLRRPLVLAAISPKKVRTAKR